MCSVVLLQLRVKLWVGLLAGLWDLGQLRCCVCLVFGRVAMCCRWCLFCCWTWIWGVIRETCAYLCSPGDEKHIYRLKWEHYGGIKFNELLWRMHRVTSSSCFVMQLSRWCESRVAGMMLTCLDSIHDAVTPVFSTRDFWPASSSLDPHGLRSREHCPPPLVWYSGKERPCFPNWSSRENLKLKAKCISVSRVSLRGFI
jgi:hypothetical protein